MSSSSTLIEASGHAACSFIRGMTEHYNPQEPAEYTAESFGYIPLVSTGKEWYLHGNPDDEFIYQEYRNREATSLDHRTQLGSPEIMLTDASSMEENDETQEHDADENEEMAWKRLRPFALRTVCKSMYTGASISLLTATIIGSVYMMICYLCFKIINICEFYPKKSIPVKVQWVRSISAAISTVFLYPSFFVCMLFLLRQHQLKGIKRRLLLVICIAWFLDTTYRLYLQAKGKSHAW